MLANYSTVVGLFKGIVQAYPGRVAVKDSAKSFTYHELYCHAAALAEVLAKHQVKAAARVVCLTGKNAESIVCFWGILMAGAIPVMLDQEDGVLVNEKKISKVMPDVVITDKAYKEARNYQTPVMVVDINELPGGQAATESMEHVIPGTCYILLTSGTSGNQKAVQITHANVLHYTESIYRLIGSPVNVKAAHVSTFAADLGLTNLLVALISGGMLRILNKTESTDPALFKKVMDEDEITLLKITPSHLSSLVAHIQLPLKSPVHNLILGGEKLSWKVVQHIFSTGICKNLYNHYGPTETTVGAMAFKVEKNTPHFNETASVPIGKPLGEGICFIDGAAEDAGELFIAGPGVSSGYFMDETESNKKFLVKTINGENRRCYKTGDFCKKLNDGNIEFLYRTDRQVKVKGYRVELGEIEEILSAHPAIENIIADVSQSGAHSVLDAFIQPVAGEMLREDELRTWLSGKLPTYKIPAKFYFYTDIPYNSNGKIDLHALRKLFKPGHTEHIAKVDKSNDLSWSVTADAVWKNVLNRMEVLPTDNFFETGGDSLLAIQLIGRLQRYGFKIHITDLNNNPVFADFIGLDQPLLHYSQDAEIKKHAINKFTHSQYQFLQQRKFGLNDYCQAVLLETEQKINIRELALAFDCVLESHSQLTTAFRKRPGNFIAERRPFSCSGLGTTVLDNNTPVVVQVQDICNDLLSTISLEKGLLLAAHVFVDAKGKDYLYFACHHLVVDVISWSIILDELFDYYGQILNGNLPVVASENTIDQFFHAIAQEKQDVHYTHEIYPQKICRLVKPEVNDIPVDAVTVHTAIVPQEVSAALLHLDEQKKTVAINGVLLSAFANALFTEFRIPEITIDLEFHGRPQYENLPDLSRSVAWWATTHPLHLETGKSNPKTCLEKIEKAAAAANRVNLFGNKFSEMPSTRSDVLFNYLGRFPSHFGNDSIRLTPAAFNPGPTRGKNAQHECKLFFTARFIGESLMIDIQYAGKKFPGTKIRDIVQSFFNNLSQHVQSELAAPCAAEILVLESNIPSIGQPLFNMSGAGLLNGAQQGKNIFLTGATGFLGIHLLKELLYDGHAIIYCLVRGENQLHAERRIENCFQYYFRELPANYHSRVKVVCGDLTAENFGISKDRFEEIAIGTDLVLHAAADINLLKEYSDLLPLNVLSTKNIVRFAQTGNNKQLHYISTLAVSGFSGKGEYRNFSEEDFDYGQFFISDYERTKFEAEKIIRQFFQQQGQGKIYRVGHIAADSVNGKFQRNIEQNRIYQIIKGIILLKQAPAAYDENISFSYVDIVAKGIAGLCTGSIQTGMQCIHLENTRYLPFTTIVEMLCQSGFEIETVELEVFKDAVENFEGSPGNKKTVDLMNNWVQRYIDYPRRINYVQRNSLDLLALHGLYFPRSGPEWFSSMVSEAIKTGYFPAPPGAESTLPMMLDTQVV